MKLEIDVKELVVEGIPATDRATFARRLEHELSQRLRPAATEPESRAIREVKVERLRPLGSASDAAADVAAVVDGRTRR